MKYTPLVSVILPCYNAEKYLNEAIDSILTQTYTNLEVIVIDDGSSDNTLSILKQYARQDKRVKLIENDKNLGLIETLNKGITIANGDLIARMDADDVSYSTRFQKQVACFKNNSTIDLVSTAREYIDLNGKHLYYSDVTAVTSKICQFAAFFVNPLAHGTVIARAEVFKEFYYKLTPDTIHVEDYELWTRMLNASKHLFSLNDYLYKTRINPDSVSFSNEPIQIANFKKCAYNFYKNYWQENLDHDVHSILINRISLVDKIDFSTLNQVFRKLKALSSRFIDKEQITNSDELKELKKVINQQKIDILIQLLFKRSLPEKVLTFFFLLRNLGTLLSSDGLTYLKSKF